MKDNNKWYISIGVFIFFTLLGCGNGKETSPKKSEEVVNEHVHTETKSNIELDNGQKWKVDEHMMVHIRNMEIDITSMAGNESEDYTLLAKKMNKNIELLTSNCTMQGQAHDELHKWLLPFIELSGAFSNSETAEDTKINFMKLKEAFLVFNQYFN